MKTLIMLFISLSLTTSAYAKSNSKQALSKKMISACKADLAKEPALTDTKDAESVWKNLEAKENDKIKLSKKCHVAHERYEHKFHKGEEKAEKY